MAEDIDGKTETPSPDQVTRDRRVEEISVLFERTLLVIYGATLTVVAGFLSQVWGTANVEFRSGIASVLNALGGMFLFLILVPTFRLFPDLMPTSNPRGRHILMVLWTGSLAIALSVYTAQMRKLGDLIEYFAAL